MILTIKATSYEQLPDGRLRIIADVEHLKSALREHSPNLLVDYLNEEHGTKIPRITPPLGGWGANRKEVAV